MATEIPEKPAVRTLLETWGKNDRMRHIPPVEWMIDKLDHDLRRRIAKLTASIAAVPANEAIEAEERALCRAIERLADAAKHVRSANPSPAETGARIEFALNHAIAALGSLDPTLFGRRYPFQTFERSKGEPIYGALLVIIDRVHRLTALVRSIDSRIDEKLLESLVNLQQPMQEKAIA